MDIQYAREFGYKLKLLAIGKRVGEQVEARVHPTMIPSDYPLAAISGVYNSVRLVGDFSGPVMLSGYGAGMEATASAVMGDVLSLARDMRTGASMRVPALGCPQDKLSNYKIKPMNQIDSSYYLRCTVQDQPGVLSKISGILGRYNISIESMIQPHRHEVGAVPIVFMTHEASESNVSAALEEIDQLDVVQEKTLLIRIENQLE